MFLEPIYLNESMLMNCASYLFGGVALNEEHTNNDTQSQTSKGELSAGGKFGVNMFSNLINANGNTNLNHQRDNKTDSQIKSNKKIALGAIHMSVIEQLELKNFLRAIESEALDDFVNANEYVQFNVNLKPFDYFAILQILQLIVPQLENIFNLFGDKIIEEDKKDKRKSKEKRENIIKSFSLIDNLVNQLKSTYTESKQLEMLMIDDKDRIIGVVDIETSEQFDELKSKLTDGKFIVTGKITKYVDKSQSINLLKRTLFSTIMEKIEVVINYFDETQGQGDTQEQSAVSSLASIKEVINPLLDKLLQAEIKGSAVRVKALSVSI